MKLLSTKQFVDPQSIKALKYLEEEWMSGEQSFTVMEFGLERADVLSFTRVAQSGSAQPNNSVESGGLLPNFFDLSVLAGSALAAHALDELDMDFGHSFATCPERPQNMQRLLSKRR